jgi:acyl-CoA thioesterase
MSSFDELSKWKRGDDGKWRGDVTPDWLQGIGAFGGLVTATNFNAMMEAVGPEVAPLSIDTSYCKPVTRGNPELGVEIAVRGRSVTQAMARIEHQGVICAISLGSFGKPRNASLRFMPVPRRFDPSEGTPFVEKTAPEFTKNFEIRWTDGGVPFSGDQRQLVGGYCRHLTAASGYGALIGLLDAWPTPVLPCLTFPITGSTIRWSVHFTGKPPAPGEWFWFRAETISAINGYVTTMGRLHGPSGEMVAWMEQMLAIYEKPEAGPRAPSR